MKTLNLTENEEMILNFLADYPARSFFSSEIAKKTRLSAGSAHNALRKLREKKFIGLEERGRMKFWKIDEGNILMKQYRVAFLLDKLSKFSRDIKKISIEAVLFGSGARGEYGKDSDIDIFVLVHDKDHVREIVKFYQKKFPIKAIIKTPNEWQELEIKEPEFHDEIKRGIKL